ncbi:MAG: M61 family metallopeptidase [Betaproteobacteria bacterium]
MHSSAQAPDAAIQYRFAVPEPEHHWMQVEATFPDLPAGTLELRMSRSSPGRYALHDFAKNVYDVHAFGPDGHELSTTRPDPYGWNVPAHGSSVTVKYRIYGDRVDGTYLAIDSTHVHMNMPAAVMWAHGLEDRPATLTFEVPAGRGWRIATQLYPGAGPETFTAPNLEYLMDSPTQIGPLAMRQFTVGSRTFRFSLHHTGTDAELDGYVQDVEKIVRQEGAIYGEFPQYEPGSYTFLADYLPYASGDGMEHRNSTVMTARGSIRTDGLRLLGTVAHEFFHCWNVERIRPAGLEPFDFDRANLTDSLWLAEGFTQYYGPLVLERAGITDVASEARTLGGLVDAVTNDPGRLVRSAVGMSRMAAFIDGGRPLDRTNWSRTVISYYTFGGAIALAMDLSLRERSNGQVSLDDFMRAMWRRFGKPGGTREGYVDHPYTVADAEATLAEVSGDKSFAHEFFSKYIEGHDVADYGRLLSGAGLELRKRNPGGAWLGDVRLEGRAGGVFVAALVGETWPAYAAGLDQDDELRALDGDRIGSPADVAAVLRRHRPGDRIPMAFVDRGGQPVTATITLAEDPHVIIVPAEDAGATITPAQQALRDGWLKPRP